MGAPNTNLDQARYTGTFGAGPRPAHDYTLGVPAGPVRLVVRSRGGLIRSLAVRDLPLLVSGLVKDPWAEPWKLDGTITMCPPGPVSLRPQHGESRLTDYACAAGGAYFLELRGYLPLQDLGHIKTYQLLPDGLVITDQVLNLGKRLWRGGLGEHLYLPLPTIDDLSMDWLRDGASHHVTGRIPNGDLLKGPLEAFRPVLLTGGTVATTDFDGAAELFIPGIGRVIVEATARRQDQPRPVTIWLWHRPNTATWCFEPVTGVAYRANGRLRHDAITLAPGQSLTLTCRIRLAA